MLILCSTIFIACTFQHNPFSKGKKYTSGIAVNGSPKEISVMFINAGKADSALIKIDHVAYLIDTGNKDSVPAIYAALEYCGIETLEGVFLTHTHSDHIGGLKGINQKYQINHLYSAKISMNTEEGSNKIDDLAKNLSLQHTKLHAGDMIEITKDIYFTVIAPLVNDKKNDNDNSMILKLKVNDKTFLFAGDMQFNEEATILASKQELSADVLKVGNHGNKDATSAKFAAAVSPEIAVISTNTDEDKNSANKRVKDLLDKSEIYLTEDADLGVLLRMQEGKIKVSKPRKKASTADIQIVDVSRKDQTVTMINHGEDISLSGYFIYSVKGNEIFNFPQDSILLAGQSLTIACEGGSGDYIWEESSVWSKKKDSAVLYDNYGNVVSAQQPME